MQANDARSQNSNFNSLNLFCAVTSVTFLCWWFLMGVVSCPHFLIYVITFHNHNTVAKRVILNVKQYIYIYAFGRSFYPK